MALEQQGRSSGDNDGLQLGGGAVATGAGVAGLGAFMVQNTDDVEVSFLFWDFTWPVWLLIIVSALVGAPWWDSSRPGCASR
jgi:hypothetical protein